MEPTERTNWSPPTVEDYWCINRELGASVEEIVNLIYFIPVTRKLCATLELLGTVLLADASSDPDLYRRLLPCHSCFSAILCFHDNAKSTTWCERPLDRLDQCQSQQFGQGDWPRHLASLDINRRESGSVSRNIQSTNPYLSRWKLGSSLHTTEWASVIPGHTVSPLNSIDNTV